MSNQNKKRKKSIDGHFSESINLRFFTEKNQVFDKYNTEAMLESQVHALAIGNEGELWVGTEGGFDIANVLNSCNFLREVGTESGVAYVHFSGRHIEKSAA